jgi:cell fate regulator YaaT (PSP1 superfamily)
MSDSRQKDRSIEDIEGLEDVEVLGGSKGGREAKSSRPAQNVDELPDQLYRLKTLHSFETFFGFYIPSGSDWPHFRTMEELNALLEGPVADHCAEAAARGAIEETETAEAFDAEIPPAPQPEERLIPHGALVVSPTKYGKDVVEVQGLVKDTRLVNLDEVVCIERPACIDDLRKLKENADKEKQAFELCRDKIWARNLPMKLVAAHYLIDEPKILFYFSAETRVDFRELVKDLVSVFKTRIELRQIGVRDESRVTGGCGVCGRVLCCHGISDRLNPVSIKMAKDQNLSLNSLKISGPCGRLLCCLSYEYQFYRDARRELPQEGVKFLYDGVLFKVVEVNALSSMVKMAGEDGRVLDMKAERFKYSEGRWKVIEEAVNP